MRRPPAFASRTTRLELGRDRPPYLLVPSEVFAEAGEHQTERASRPALLPCAFLDNRSHDLAHALRFIIYELL
jgi:hypothetical protein